MKSKLLKWLITAVAAAVFAIPSFAQISVSVKDRAVSEVLPEIEKQGSFKFFYSSELPDLDARVSIDVKNKDLKSTLDILFDGLRIAYDIRSPKLVVLSAKSATVARQVSSDKKKVSGRVMDSDGLPVIAL
ncbi:MAG: STN domain-containing protein, partial [Candidatus Cryptobacteroides sp.]